VGGDEGGDGRDDKVCEEDAYGAAERLANGSSSIRNAGGGELLGEVTDE
jgi:hypothetical protein